MKFLLLIFVVMIFVRTTVSSYHPSVMLSIEECENELGYKFIDNDDHQRRAVFKCMAHKMVRYNKNNYFRYI